MEDLSEKIAKQRSMGRFLYCKLKEAVDCYQDLKQAKLYLNTLRKYFPEPEDKIFLQTLLTSRQIEDLKQLITNIQTEVIEKDFICTAEQKIVEGKILFPNNEFEIRDLVIKQKLDLAKILSIKELKEHYIEYSYEELGKVDLMFLGDDNCYPIEIKDETATERVSGQIKKYVKGAIRLLKNSSYNWVYGVVIAPNFTKEALRQLIYDRIIPIQVSKQNNLLKFEEPQ